MLLKPIQQAEQLIVTTMLKEQLTNKGHKSVVLQDRFGLSYFKCIVHKAGYKQCL